MNALDAAQTVLEQAKTPLSIREITERILAQNLWQTRSKIPLNTISAAITVDIAEKGSESRFQRPDRGLFALRAWESPESQQPPLVPQRPLTILEAAKQVLAAAGEPLDCDELTRRMQAEGLWQARGKTPAASVSAVLAVDIAKRSANSHFQRTARGVFALRSWNREVYIPSSSSSADAQALQQQLTVAQDRIGELETELRKLTQERDAARRMIDDLERGLPMTESYPDQLTGQQLRAGQTAFLAAFPNYEALRQMVRHELEQSLESIVPRTSVEIVVFDLLQWAQTMGQIPALLKAAAATNPENPQLKSWLASLTQVKVSG